MHIQLPYGNKTLGFTIPEGIDTQVLEPNRVAASPAEGVQEMLARAVDNPIGSPRLEDIVRPGQTVALLCDDRTRPTPARLILPFLIGRLLERGIRKQDIAIIIALGSHRPMTQEEIASKVGEEIAREYPVLNSEFQDEARLAYVGDAPDGSKIYVFDKAMECDVRIGVGSITPHAVMGWGGGGKILYPGVAGEKTVAAFHSMSAATGRMYYGMEESPIRLHVEKWVGLIGLDFIVNTVLTPDMGIYRVVAGHYVRAQRQGVRYAKEVWGAKIEKKADVVIVSSHPIDHDLWQSGKAFPCGEMALRDLPGGTILHVSPNYEGMGPHKEYGRIIGMDDPTGLLREITGGRIPQGMDPLAVAVGNDIWNLRQRHRLVMVTDGISRQEVEACKIGYYPSSAMQTAVDEALSRYDNPRVAVIGQGGELVVYS